MIDKLRLLTEAFGGTVFKTPDYLNLVGVRSPGDVNKFNDTLYYYWFDSKGKPEIRSIKEFTTDPGLKILRAPITTKGTAVVKEGWYRRMWKLGKHKNSYPALVQANPCVVFRDNNRNAIIDFNPETIESGLFGINLHRASERLKSIQVDGWSAGCQVVADSAEFKKLMDRVYIANSKGQTLYSYLLVRNSDLLK